MVASNYFRNYRRCDGVSTGVFDGTFDDSAEIDGDATGRSESGGIYSDYPNWGDYRGDRLLLVGHMAGADGMVDGVVACVGAQEI